MRDGDRTGGKSAGRKLPRYREILGIVRKRIVDGVYPVGANLPSEAEFCREFAASRFTVREALRRLQADGMVERHQGAGSRVIRAAPPEAFVQSSGSTSELFRYALDTHLEILGVEKARLDDRLAAAVGGRPGETWTLVRSLRRRTEGGAPLCLIESYVPARLDAAVRRLDSVAGPVYAALEAASGETIVEAVQEAQAMAMPRHVAEAMAVPAGSVSLRLLRRYATARGTLVASFNWHLGGESFVHRTRLSHRDAAR